MKHAIVPTPDQMYPGLNYRTEQETSAGIESREERESVPRTHHLDFSKSLKTVLLSGKNGVGDWEAHAVKATCHQKQQDD